MGQSRIPVDLQNPGQVFACMGFMEAADILCGGAEGWFDWHGEPCFMLLTEKEDSPFSMIFDFLIEAEVYAVTSGKQKPEIESGDDARYCPTFPDKEPNEMALPILLRGKGVEVVLGHWADGSSRDNFKLYAGNRTACSIAVSMIHGVEKKGTKGVSQIYTDDHAGIINDPFNVLCDVGGSFNLDHRGGWTSIDVGFSPNDLKMKELKARVLSSPVVEIMAAWGLEHARPKAVEQRLYRYAVWSEALSPGLARAVMGCGVPSTSLPQRRFCFPLALSGKNKVIVHATEEIEK